MAEPDAAVADDAALVSLVEAALALLAAFVAFVATELSEPAAAVALAAAAVALAAAFVALVEAPVSAVSAAVCAVSAAAWAASAAAWAVAAAARVAVSWSSTYFFVAASKSTVGAARFSILLELASRSWPRRESSRRRQSVPSDRTAIISPGQTTAPTPPAVIVAFTVVALRTKYHFVCAGIVTSNAEAGEPPRSSIAIRAWSVA